MTPDKAIKYLTTGYAIFMLLLGVYLCTTSSPYVPRAWHLGHELTSMRDRFLAARVAASKQDWEVRTPFLYVVNDPDPSDAPDYDVTGWIKDYPYVVYFNMDYGLDGDYKAVRNVQFMAEEKLWAEIKDGKMKYRAPCGGRADCSNPLAVNVPCFVEQTDCNFGKPGLPYQDPKVLKTFFLECRGDVVCRRDQKPEDCCLITKTVKGKVLDL